MAQPTPPLAACQGGAVVVAGQRGAGTACLPMTTWTTRIHSS